MRTELGKIENISIGACGYQEAMFGISLTFSGKGWGVSTTIVGGWNTEIGPLTKWTEADRLDGIGKAFNEIRLKMNEAKVDDVIKLKGVPVECTFDGNKLKSWRILTEVI